MPGGLLVALGALGAVIAASAVARVRRMRRAGAPHATLATVLATGGTVSIGLALLISGAGWATAATPRFYTAMLLGIGLGALLAALYLDLVDRRA
jgi:hypothetical protein